MDVHQGNPATYQLQGPTPRAAQESPVFEDLSAGTYTIIVTDNCGERLSQSFEIQKAEFLIDSEFQQFENELKSCGVISVGHQLNSIGSDISYPLQVKYLIYTPGGDTEEVNIVIATGSSSENIFFADLPFFHDQAYTYDITITDNCGQTTALEGNTINRKLSISNDLLWGAGLCGRRSCLKN